jgi:hypothetical protein
MLFRKDMDPRCAYCAKGSRIGEDKVACVKRGVVMPEDHCGAPEAGAAPADEAGYRQAAGRRFSTVSTIGSRRLPVQ